MSGVTVCDNAVDIFNAVKNKSGPVEDRIRVVSLTIQDQGIDVESIFRQKELDAKNEDACECFLNLLEKEECRYVLYDCHYRTDESVKEDLVLATWCADDAIVKKKLKYASSKDALVKAFKGVKRNLQLNDKTDCHCHMSVGKLVNDHVKSVEGKDVHDH